MKKKRLTVILAWALFAARTFCVYADGTTSANETQPVEVTSTPVPIAVPASRVQEIGHAFLEYQELYQSQYIPVAEYHRIVFFVKHLNLKGEPELPLPLCKIDAYFSDEANNTGIIDLNTKTTTFVQPGWQEFGAFRGEGEGERPSFVKTSNEGEPTLILSTPVYGPYCRIEVKNLTPGDKKNFKIIAYTIP